MKIQDIVEEGRASHDPDKPTHPLQPAAKFAAAGLDIKQGPLTVARAASTNMAKRIANALNNHTPNREGV